MERITLIALQQPCTDTLSAISMWFASPTTQRVSMLLSRSTLFRKLSCHLSPSLQAGESFVCFAQTCQSKATAYSWISILWSPGRLMIFSPTSRIGYRSSTTGWQFTKHGSANSPKSAIPRCSGSPRTNVDSSGINSMVRKSGRSRTSNLHKPI